MRRAIARKTVFILIILFSTAVLFLSTNPVRAAENFWAEKSPMPEPKSNSGVATVNGRIYVLGSSNYEYDTVADTWTIKADMPTPRSSFGIAAYQNKIYVIGGRLANNSITGVNEVYDPTTDTWETKAPLPIGRWGSQANVVDDKIYLISGFPGVKTPATILNDVYDPSTDTWTTQSPIQNAVAGYSSAVVDSKIYVIGGGNMITPLNLTQVYDTKTDTWSSGAPPPIYTNGAVAATTGLWAPKLIYLIGGTTAGNTTNINQVFNPQNNTWSTAAPMPNDRAGLTVAVVNDTIYALGGSRGIIHADQISLNEFTNVTSMVSYELSVNEQYFPLGYTGPISPSTIPYATPTPSPPASTSPSPSSTFTTSPSPSNPSPSPTIPEFPFFIVLLLLAVEATFFMAFRKREKGK